MIDLAKCIEAVITAEEENRNIYDIYGQITDHYSARNLLATLESASRNRLESLQRLTGNVDFTSIVVDGESLVEPEIGVEHGFDAGMRYIDFLMLICRREQALADLYRSIERAVDDDQLRTVFAQLADDCAQRERLVQSRYDLETLV